MIIRRTPILEHLHLGTSEPDNWPWWGGLSGNGFFFRPHMIQVCDALNDMSEPANIDLDHDDDDDDDDYYFDDVVDDEWS